MEHDKEETDDTIASHGDEKTREMDSNYTRLQLEPHDSEVSYVIGAEGKDEDEEGVQRHHPEDMLQEDQRSI